MSSPSNPLTILFLTPECTPFVQVGGLGDVAASLPVALRRQGHDPRIVMPLYGGMDRSCCERLNVRLPVRIGGEVREAQVWRSELDAGVPLYLLEEPGYFDREGVYGPNGSSYEDNLRRFTFLSQAALLLPSRIGFEPNIVHANDWPTALAILYAKHQAPPRPTVFTLHNVGYQGRFPLVQFGFTGLPPEELNPNSLEHFGTMNLLKAAVLNASMLTTVSPTYSKEIQYPAFGCGLDGVLRSRARDLHGILNGIDTETWDPSKDLSLPARYDAMDLSGKALCKASLQREAGLPQRPEVPLFGLVTRLTHQKGLDVLARALRRILDLDVQFVLLGTGDLEAEKFFRTASELRPNQFHTWIGFDPALARRIEAGCDFFVMPSRYEPCGLNQMYSLRYGTLPIVRATGGLEDSVDNYDERTGAGTGFKLYDLNPSSVYDVVGWAVSTWYDRPEHIQAMRSRAMGLDFSWERAAQKYDRVYRLAMAHDASVELLRAG